MQVTEFIIVQNPGGRPLQLSVKRYRFADYDHWRDEPGTILILTHGAGFHKEIWEPFLQEIDEAQRTSDLKGTSRIKEAWTVDCPNHGPSAVLNDEFLFHDKGDVLLEEFARSPLRVLRSGLIENMEKERIILVGHSVGSLAAAWAAYLYHKEDNKVVDSCIMIEPPGEIFGKLPILKQKSLMFLEATKTRRDIWSSKSEALEWLGARRPWKLWDKRALQAYVDHGLRPLPSIWYPDKQGVTLSCHRDQEAFAYTDLPELNVVANLLPSLRQVMPVHILVSGKSFLRASDKICEQIASTPGMSLTKMPESDHLVVQEMPGYLTRFVLDTVASRNSQEARSRL